MLELIISWYITIKCEKYDNDGLIPSLSNGSENVGAQCGLLYVIVAFSGHTHLPLNTENIQN